MRYMVRCTPFLVLIAALLAPAPASLSAGEKALMHCFAFTEIEGASSADWKAFKDATNALPGKIEGLKRVWLGKLRRPLRQYGRNQDEPSVRQWGVCMEMDDEAALGVYAQHDAHTAWVKVYEKVRVPGTTTFDILGE